MSIEKSSANFISGRTRKMGLMVIYVLLLILCCFVVLFFWFNRSSEQIYKTLATPFGAIVGASFYLAVRFLSPHNEEVYKIIAPVVGTFAAAAGYFAMSVLSPILPIKDTVFVTLYRGPDRSLLPLYQPLGAKGIPGGGGYVDYDLLLNEWRRKFRGTNNWKYTSVSQDKNFFADLLELTTIHWLAANYSNHWMLERYPFRDAGADGFIFNRSPDADKKFVKLTTEKITTIFAKNELIAAGVLTTPDQENDANQSAYFDVFSPTLPDGSTVSESRSDNVRTITIKNCFSQLDLTIGSTYYGSPLRTGRHIKTLDEKIMHFFKISDTSAKDLWVDHFFITFERKDNRWLRWSRSTVNQKKWTEEMVNLFRQTYGWENFEPNLERALEN